jgi:hypothetical protein
MTMWTQEATASEDIEHLTSSVVKRQVRELARGL